MFSCRCKWNPGKIYAKNQGFLDAFEYMEDVEAGEAVVICPCCGEYILSAGKPHFGAHMDNSGEGLSELDQGLMKLGTYQYPRQSVVPTTKLADEQAAARAVRLIPGSGGKPGKVELVDPDEFSLEDLV